jgi:hypothetical protein
MNETTTITGRQVAKLAAGAPIVGIVPTTIEETFRLAELVHQSGLAPYQLKSAQAVAVVLLKGLEVGLPPMSALECIGVINGKACLHSDGIPSLLWSRGFKIKEWYEGDTLDSLVAKCVVTRPDGTAYEGSFSVQEAKEARLWDTREKVKRKIDGEWKEVANDAPWFKYKRRMLKMRARGWTARDAASDVLKGIPLESDQDPIELQPGEYAEIKPALRKVPANLPDIPDAAEPAASPEPASQQPPKHPAMTDLQFMEALDSAYATANDLDALNEHMVANEHEIEERGLEQACAEIYRRHMGRIYDKQ